MGIAISLLLIGAGAILTWAVTATVSGIDLNTAGVILMVVGVVSLALTLIFWNSWWGPGAMRRPYGRRTVVEDEAATPPPPA